MSKSFQLLAAIIGVLGVGITVGALVSPDSDKQNDLQQNINVVVDNSIKNMPEDKKAMAVQVKEVINDIFLESSDENNDSKESEKLKNFLAESMIVNYSISSSPFIPQQNKAILLCENIFSYAFSDIYDIKKQKVLFKINGTAKYWSPGDEREFEKDQKRLLIRYMEFKEDIKRPVIMFECA